MKKIMGMDISSSTIGWALLEAGDGDIFLKRYGHIKPPNSSKGSLACRMDIAYNSVEELLRDVSPDEIAVENYPMRFSSGRSSARTIIVLSVFNEFVSFLCLRVLGIEPNRYSVMSIRSSISKYLNKKIISKEEMLEAILEHFETFEVKLNRNKKIRKESGDESDAIAVALCHIIKTGE